MPCELCFTYIFTDYFTSYAVKQPVKVHSPFMWYFHMVFHTPVNFCN